jgi:predicted RNase H-like HicB family nuclease
MKTALFLPPLNWLFSGKRREFTGLIAIISDGSMKKKFSVLVEKDEDGFLVATVPTLPGCHTQARSMDDLLERAKEAIEAYLEAYTGSG